MAKQETEISLRRAATLLGIHYMTARQWAIQGRLPHRRDITGHYWVPRAWVADVRRAYIDPT